MGIPQAAFSVRMDPIVVGKLRTLAQENGRSRNKQIEFSWKRYLKVCEAERGKVEVTEP